MISRLRNITIQLDEALQVLEEARFKIWVKTEVWPEAVDLWLDEICRTVAK